MGVTGNVLQEDVDHFIPSEIISYYSTIGVCMYMHVKVSVLIKCYVIA